MLPRAFFIHKCIFSSRYLPLFSILGFVSWLICRWRGACVSFIGSCLTGSKGTIAEGGVNEQTEGPRGSSVTLTLKRALE